MVHVQVGDLGRSSVGGKGVPIDVRRGLRFQSPEAICSGTTSKVSPCITLHHNLLTTTSSPQPPHHPAAQPLTTAPSPQSFTTTPHQTPSPQPLTRAPTKPLHHSIHTTAPSPQPFTTIPHHNPSPPALSTSAARRPTVQLILLPANSGNSLQCDGHCYQLLSSTVVTEESCCHPEKVGREGCSGNSLAELSDQTTTKPHFTEHRTTRWALMQLPTMKANQGDGASCPQHGESDSGQDFVLPGAASNVGHVECSFIGHRCVQC